MSSPKTVLFFPLNSPGHINSSLGIADRIKRETQHRTVFLVLGPMIGTSVVDHGHELVIMDELDPYEDYELEFDDDLGQIVDDEILIKKGKVKKPLPGVFKWPQLLYRNQHFCTMDPLDAFICTAPLLEKVMVGELISNHDTYVKAIGSIKPDIIIIDAYYLPPCVLNYKGIPWVKLYSANPLMLLESKLPDGSKPPAMLGCSLMTKQKRLEMQTKDMGKWQTITAGWREALGKIYKALDNANSSLQDFMTNQGCEPLPSGKQSHDSPYLNIYMFPKALDYDQDDDLFQYPKRWVRCDSMLRNSANGAIERAAIDAWKSKIDEMAQTKKQIVFFSLGSIASGNVHQMKRLIKMLAHDQERLYLISTGVNGHKFKLDEGNMLGDKYVPQSYFLERADLAIIHGGNNSVTECLYYGLPMIILPAFADQIDNAQRIQDLGLGKRLDLFRCGQDELLESVDDILSNVALRERLSDIGREMRARDDVGKVLKLLEKLLNDKQLDEDLIEEIMQ